jgi:hypothetical protein
MSNSGLLVPAMVTIGVPSVVIGDWASYTSHPATRRLARTPAGPPRAGVVDGARPFTELGEVRRTTSSACGRQLMSYRGACCRQAPPRQPRPHRVAR